MPKLGEHRVRAEIDVSALKYNYRTLRDMAAGSRPICVVKADAYGHACEICVPSLLEEGCDFFAVSCIDEAIAVRRICQNLGRSADVLILGYTDPCQVQLLSTHGIIQTLISEEYAKQLNAAASLAGIKVRAHAALDTGMNRIGICARDEQECEEAAETIAEISKLNGILLEGMYTHLCRADEQYEAAVLSKDSFTLRQARMFTSVQHRLSEYGIKLFAHVCNSAAAARFPDLALDGVRIGILLYGVQPSKHLEVPVRPVMSLKTVVSHVHAVNAGQTVGYGGAYLAKKDTKIATLAVGYGDGFLRSYSGATVTIHTASGDHNAKIIGRICMDQCMIDATGIPVSVGDTATLFGKDPAKLRALSEMADTIEYECLCLISARVPRVIK
ncbi:MAG: alanine racemase [Clostridia bacterium]|nr:alanine racemase [Clostridia bacterium]